MASSNAVQPAARTLRDALQQYDATDLNQGSTMFMVTTLDGVRTYAGDKGTGMTADQAVTHAAACNAKALKLGIKSRYKSVTFVPVP